ncbi:MAG: hypothetical protein RLY31_1012, partial [Bacteroidota bacterium]
MNHFIPNRSATYYTRGSVRQYRRKKIGKGRLRIGLLLLCLATSLRISAQPASAINPWTYIPAAQVPDQGLARPIVPQAYQTVQLDVATLRSTLADAPRWFTPAASTADIRLTLPFPDGGFGTFRIEYAPVMADELAAKYPDIRTFAGYGVDDPHAYARFDLTPAGFHGFIRSPLHSDVFIDPYAMGDTIHYMAYYKKDFSKDTDWTCGVEDNLKDLKNAPPGLQKAGDCKLRTYTLALACTGEYATFHGGTVIGALAAMNTTMTRVNGIFELDASIHMDLVSNNDTLVFLDPATDPYSNSNGSAMLGENQTTCDNRIGSANYDIGHVFSTGGGGVAYLNSPCTNIKAGGVTGQTNPVGDPFDVDYVAHEMGHQYGATHTQNNACNRSSATAMEPGSASTIMGYAGICSPNVQNNSDAYFHAVSLAQMGNFVTGSTGNSCATSTVVNPGGPTALAGSDHTIPRSTPFALTGIGSDPNNTALTYCWEQMDNQVATMPPASTNTGGPTFRSLTPTTSPTRYFPNWTAILNNSTPTWEVLPSVGRNLNFRFTVRDNHPGGGCTAEDNMVVTVDGNAGPFLVTSPNTTVNWPALSTQSITWDVANTTAAPVSCAFVDILLSLDGGASFPITLASATPNDGEFTTVIPNNQTNQARIMIRGNGNIFFDLSNSNFTISEPVNGFSIAATPAFQSACQPVDTISVSVGILYLGSFQEPVSFSLSGLPAGANAVFHPAQVISSDTVTLSLFNLGSVPDGVYPLTVTGSTASNLTESAGFSFQLFSTAPTAPIPLIPGNQLNNISTTPVFEWESVTGADSYSFQLSTDSDFVNLIHSASMLPDTMYPLPIVLSFSTTYFWRVQGNNVCGNGVFSNTYSFNTGYESCKVFASTDVPKTISSTGAVTVYSSLPIDYDGTVTDLNVVNLNISHTWINDLIVTVIDPAATEVDVIQNICERENNIITNFDDEAANPYNSLPCPPVNNGFYQPAETLSAFDGKSLLGNWQLKIQDVFNQDGGSLNSWSLEICYLCIVPAITQVNVTQPACTSPTGSISVLTEQGPALEYSLGGTSGWQPSNVFPNLSPGSYNVLVRLQGDTTCQAAYAGNPIVLDSLPVFFGSIQPVICQGDSFLFHGQSYTQAGTYVDTLSTSEGCDSIVTISLAVLSLSFETVNTSICQGESYSFNGNSYSVAGTYVDTLTAANGCDSVVTLQLTVQPNVTASETASICQGESFSFNGNSYSVAGTYVDTLTATNGCDSVFTLQLTVLPSANQSETAVICQGESYSFNGNSYSVAGTYVDTLTAANGCDSVVTLQLTVLPSTTGSETASICQGESYSFNGNSYSVAGTYVDTLTAVNGCDSVVTLQLTVLPSASSSAAVSICQGESYSYNGNSYSVAGTYVDTLTAANGCDSVVTLELTVLPNFTGSAAVSICQGESYSFNGNSYSVAG